MALYTDGTHLVSDKDLNELHAFAGKIGLKRHYFEGVRKGHPHYDLTNAHIRGKAVENGAITVSSRRIVLICKRHTKETSAGIHRLKSKKQTKTTIKMKVVRFILILAIATALASCSQEKSPETSDSDQVPNIVSASVETAPEKPFSNPVLIYGSSFGEYFQALYKTGKFEDMLKFTSSESVGKFGRDKILEFYKKMDFAYGIKLKSKNESAGVTTLNYEAGIMATTSMLRIDVVLENDTCKILLKDLKGLR